MARRVCIGQDYNNKQKVCKKQHDKKFAAGISVKCEVIRLCLFAVLD